MNFRLIKKFINARRYTIFIFFIIFIFIISGIFSPSLFVYLSGKWEKITENKISDHFNLIQKSFNNRQLALKSTVEEVASELLNSKISLTGNLEQSIDLIFETFRQKSNGYKFHIFNEQFKLIAWNNKPLTFSDSLLKDDNFFIYKKNFETFLVYVKYISLDKNRNLILVTADRIISDFYIKNQFLSEEKFFDNIVSDDYNFLVDFSHSINDVDTLKQFRKNLFFITGQKAGIVIAEFPDKETVIGDIKESVAYLQKYLILILIFLFAVYLYRDFKRLESNLIKGLLISILLWSFRYLLLYLELTKVHFNHTVFNPAYFSSALGGGIFKSPLELFITVIVGILNTSYIFILIKRSISDNRFKSDTIYHKIFLGIISLVLLLLLPLVVRAFCESFRSFIFDSALKYFKAGAIIPDSSFIFMHISIFLASVSFMMLILSVTILLNHFFTLIFKIEKFFISASVVLTLFLLSAILFKLINHDTLYSYQFLILLIIFNLVLLYIINRQSSILNFGLIIGILIISSLASTYLLIEKNSLKEKELLRRVGFELTKPKEAILGFILNESLMSLSGNTLVLEELDKKKDQNFDLLVYKLWTSSLLNSEGTKSGISLLDKNGNKLGFFGFGILPPGNLNEFINPSVFKDDILYFNIKEYSDYLFGAVKIFKGNELKGYFVINLLTNIYSREQVSSSQIFGNLQSERTPLSLLPDAVIYRLSGGEFALEKGENLPHFRPLPKSVSSQVLERDFLEIWENEEIEGKNYITFYLLYKQNNLPRLIAISQQTESVLWYSYNFFRMTFIHFLISLFLLVFATIFIVVRGYKFKLQFKSRLFIALVFITIIPLLFLAFFNRQNALERWNQTQKYELEKDLDYLSKKLSDLSFESSSDSSQKKLSVLLNNSDIISDFDFNIFSGYKMIYSSQMHLYKLGFFEEGLPSEVFSDIFLQRKIYSYSLENIGNYQYLVGYKKFNLKNLGEIIISIPTIYKKEKIDSEIAQIDAFIFGAYSLTLIFIFILGNIVFGRISRPLKKLTEATHKIAAGDLSVKLNPEDKTEVGDLVIAFNKMIADLEESRINLARAEREYAWKEMAKQVAHEIKNPLTPMKLSLQHLQTLFKVNREEFFKIFGKVSVSLIEQIEMLNKIAGEFSRFARMPKRNIRKIELLEILSKLIQIHSTDIKIISHIPSGLKIYINADYEEIQIVFNNIFKNSVQAKADSIWIELTTEEKFVTVKIKDNGEGIDKELLDKIFEPNFSTKSDGMGLGLSIIKKIIEELNGSIDIESVKKEGTIVKITFPVAEGS